MISYLLDLIDCHFKMILIFVLFPAEPPKFLLGFLGSYHQRSARLIREDFSTSRRVSVHYRFLFELLPKVYPFTLFSTVSMSRAQEAKRIYAHLTQLTLYLPGFSGTLWNPVLNRLSESTVLSLIYQIKFCTSLLMTTA